MINVTRESAAPRHNLTVHQAEAAEFLAAWVRKGGEHPFDLVFLDAFDGDDNVPSQLSSPGEPAKIV